MSNDGRKLAWNMPQVTSLMAFVQADRMFADCKPLGLELVRKRKLYFADTPLVKFFRIRFNNEKSMRAFCRIIRREVCLEHIGTVSFLHGA